LKKGPRWTFLQLNFDNTTTIQLCLFRCNIFLDEYLRVNLYEAHCEMAEALFVFVRFLLLSQLKFSAAINNVIQHILDFKF